MTIADRIAVEGKVLGNRARLAGVIYERRGDGGWRRSKDQGRAVRTFTRAERDVNREVRRLANAQATDTRLSRMVDDIHRVGPTTMTQERQKPSHVPVTSSPAALRDFLIAVERKLRAAF